MGRSPVPVLFLSLVAVAAPWLSLQRNEIIGLWVINLTIVAVTVARRHDVQSTALRALSPTTMLGLALALLVVGNAVNTLVVTAPFYGPSSWAAIGQGLVIAGSAVAVSTRVAPDRIGEAFVVAACAAGYAGLIGLPLLFAPGAVENLLDTLATGSAATITFRGYRPLYDALDAHWLIRLPEGRGTNLRHEPALLFALALAPLPETARRPAIVTVARWAAVFGAAMSLSRSAIGSSAVVGALALVGSARHRGSPRRLAAYLVGIGLIGVLVASQLGASLTDRFAGRADNSAALRLDALTVAVDQLGRTIVGVSREDLGADFVRPHVFPLDAYLGAGVLGLASSLLIAWIFARTGWRAFRSLLIGEGGQFDGVVLAACVVSLVRYVTAGSFLNASIAWYAGGLIAGSAVLGRSTPRSSPSAPDDRPAGPPVRAGVAP